MLWYKETASEIFHVKLLVKNTHFASDQTARLTLLFKQQ